MSASTSKQGGVHKVKNIVPNFCFILYFFVFKNRNIAVYNLETIFIYFSSVFKKNTFKISCGISVLLRSNIGLYVQHDITSVAITFLLIEYELEVFIHIFCKLLCI